MPANVLAQAQQALLRLDLADWLGMCVAFALALVAARLVAMVVLRALGAMTRRTPSLFDDRLLRTAAGPLRVALFALFFSLARRPIELSKASTALFAALESSLLVIAGFWQVLRVLDLLADDYRVRFQRRGQGQAGSTLVLVHRCAKIAALGYVPERVRNQWRTSEIFEPKNESDLARFRTGYLKMSRFLKRFHDAGGVVLAGSATVDNIPGLSMLREMQMMAELGLSPREVIEIATRRNAEFLRKDKEIGTIAAKNGSTAGSSVFLVFDRNLPYRIAIRVLCDTVE
jgi:hypothetical protein